MVLHNIGGHYSFNTSFALEAREKDGFFKLMVMLVTVKIELPQRGWRVVRESIRSYPVRNHSAYLGRGTYQNLAYWRRSRLSASDLR